MDDSAVADVIGITGTTSAIAAQYLELADGDANQAVQLFFEHDGADLAGSTQTAQNNASTLTGAGNAQDPINVDEEDDIQDRVERGNTRPTTSAVADDDEAMARRLQEEMYGGAGQDENEIRAPIARQAETLLGPGSAPMTGSDLDEAVQARIAAMQSRRGRGVRTGPGIFNQHQPISSIWNSGNGYADHALAESTGGASDASSRSNMLARLFQPPWDLMFKGSWEEARDEGKEQKKWLLVNIQDGSVFDCQALNRDVWKNDSVAETVRENFILLQYSKDDPRADQYCQWYFTGADDPNQYPHIAIVDPRTGEQTKLWSRKIPKAAEFLMQLHEFLDRYSLESKVRNPVAKRKAETKKEKTVDEMTEEEMMEKALQESLAAEPSVPKSPSAEDPDDLTRSIGDLRGEPLLGRDVEEEDLMDISEPEVGASAFSKIPSTHPHSEPPQGPEVTRIQLRHPAGRLIRRFDIHDPVQRIYEYLKAEPLEGKAGVDFELVSLGKNLIDSLQETIEQAGLKNGTIMVEFIES